MKIWIDDCRPAPEGYIWLKSVNAAKRYVSMASPYGVADLDISIDHDAGDYANDGGDYIKFLDWLEETNRTPTSIRIHSMNPVGVENMRRIIQKNGWREII